MDFYHIVAIGSGFATSFFLQEYLARAAPNARILMLERSPRIPHATRIERRIFGGYADESLVRRMGDKEKQWSFSIGFGGSSNCWWGCTPRLHPSDFRLRSLYGVGRDWPIMEQDIMDKFLTATDFFEGPSTPGRRISLVRPLDPYEAGCSKSRGDHLLAPTIRRSAPG